MACNQYRVYNPESYSQNWVFDDCDGYRYSVVITAGSTSVTRDVGQIVDIGTMTLLDANGNPIQEVVDNGGVLSYENSIDWGEIYENTWFKYSQTVITNNFGSIYKIEEDSESWQNQLSFFDKETSDWNGLSNDNDTFLDTEWNRQYVSPDAVTTSWD